MIPLILGIVFNLNFTIMPKTIFKLPEAHANLQRNAFDLGNGELFTSPLGMLLPISFREVNPNEHVEIRPELYARTMPLNTAAFVKIKQNLEFFFVPYRLLWSRSTQFFPRTDYGTTTALSPYAPIYNPKVQLNSFAKFILNDTKASTHIVDDLGYQLRFGAVRLLDFLGYGDFSPYLKPDATVPTGTSTPNIFKLLAYQKIYQDFYRNDVLEAQDLTSYNVDSRYESTIGSGSLNYLAREDDIPFFTNLLKIRYRNLRNDYFTSTRGSFSGASWMSSVVSPIVLPSVSGTSSYGLEGIPTSGWQSGSDPQYDGSSMQGGIRMGTDYSSDTRHVVGFSVANLRSAYALDKLYDSMSRAKDGCYAHQMKARFGVDPNLDDYHCRFLGGTDSPLQIGEVLGTAENNLGDIGGKGTSYTNGNVIKYDVKEHGIIIGIQSFTIDSDYEANGLDRTNAKTTFSDYLQPEFSDLGYQPVYSYELDSPIDPSSTAVAIFGYNSRYAEYKTSYNRVHGIFRKNRSMSSWCCPIDLGRISNQSGIAWQRLKIDPRYMDTIMTVSYDGSEETDQFICDCSINYDIVRPISRYGLPYVN